MNYSIDTDESYKDLLAAIIEGEVSTPILSGDILTCLADYAQAAVTFKLEPVYSLKYRIKFKQYNIVRNVIDFHKMLKHIEDSEYIAYDTETTGLNTRKDIVVGFAVCGRPGEAWYLPLYEYIPELTDHSFCLDRIFEHSDAHTIITALINKKLIMHNASYDIRITKSNFGIDLSNSLYADTVLMQHTLNEESHFGLKDLAVTFSTELQFDGQDSANQEQIELELNVKAKGGKWLKSNKEMYKGDMPIIAKYCNADVDITLRLFYYLEKRLREENLIGFFYKEEVMPLYTLCTIPMEMRGVHLDLEKLKKYNFEIGIDLKKLETEVVIAILATDAGQEFVQQRLDTEFPPKNSGSFAQELAKYFDLPLPKLPSGKYQITQKTLKNLDEESAAFNFLMTGDASYLKNTYDGVSILTEIQKNLMVAKDQSEHPINIGSKTQLAKIVFELMGIKPLSKTKKGAPQFNEVIIDHLVNEHDLLWARELRVYNKLTKIKGSYFERFLEQHEDGIFYPSFKQHGTTSGRYSSDLQQLPKPIEDEEDDPEDARILKYTDIIRELVVAPEGYNFLDDDYESLEPRVFADDAADQALIDIFVKNLDMYSVVAIGAEKLEGVSADKKADNFLKKLFPNKRQNAKAYALGIRYGMKDFKLHKTLNIELAEAQLIIDNYFKSFPGLKKAMDKYLKEVKTTGRVTSKFGRVRHLPRAKELYERFGDDLLDYKKLMSLSKKHYITMADLKLLRSEYNNILNNALNFPIQSAASSLVNRAMIAIARRFKEEGLNAWMSANIHDQIITTCVKKDVVKGSYIMQDCMENTNKLLMPLIAIPEVATNFKDGH
jgi:DNA polymerase I-like protein with 3'-5' exonuclease and polymerase domains